MSLSFCLKARKWYDKHLVKFGGDISYGTLQKLVPEKSTEKHELNIQNATIKLQCVFLVQAPVYYYRTQKEMDGGVELYGLLAFLILSTLLFIGTLISYACKKKKHNAWHPQVLGLIIQISSFIQCFDIAETRFSKSDYEQVNLFWVRAMILVINTIVMSVCYPKKLKTILILICLQIVGVVCGYEIYYSEIKKR